MSNFEFLRFIPEYKLFAPAAVEAEKMYHSSPAMCAIGCRKALELAVKWVYFAEHFEPPYSDNLQSYVHGQDFVDAVDRVTLNAIPYIIKLGNFAVHSERAVAPDEALTSLKNLFIFIDWLDYTYGKNYPVPPRTFMESELPKAEVVVDTKKIREQESLIRENQSEIERLKAELEQQAQELARVKAENQQRRPEYVTPQELSEFETRRQYIDLDLKYAGWEFDGVQVQTEYPVDNMAGVPGKSNGFADYVLFGQDGVPLAVVEAKKTGVDPKVGQNQAAFYADSLEEKFGYRPVIFLTNGYKTYFWDKDSGPLRPVGGFFSRSDLERLRARKADRQAPENVPVNMGIAGRPYQLEAIRAVCEHISQSFRKNLLVMATGTGKTRTAAALVDVLARANCVTNVLFLADRTALVEQARDAFRNYLPDMSLCNLLEDKADKDARIVFSTYPTILNAIDSARTPDGNVLFTPAHFDLIVIDESHRSIFKKYRAIFDYFDAILVGLTATPKTDVDKNTYEFFECEDGIPTSAYDYDTAVNRDHVLVPYYNIEVKTDFLDNGIHYDELSPEDREKYEAYFTEDDGTLPEYIDSKEINRFVFNKDTVDMVLQDLMRNGIKVAGGDRIAKTIIFAQNSRHADFIVERFNALYPRYGGTFCRRVVCADPYAQDVLKAFKAPAPPAPWSAEEECDPQIAVSVDMMDTGIDVPHIGNLVFFKKVFSKIKFWQMIGRGTRLCPDMVCVDGKNGEYVGKKYFYIFDYCGNFRFFREKPNGIEGADAMSLSQALFTKQVKLIKALQDEKYASDTALTAFRQSLTEKVHRQVEALNEELAIVRLYREAVQKFKDISAFDALDETALSQLTNEIALLVSDDDTDEYAKRYDNQIYALMLDLLSGKDVRKSGGKLSGISVKLSRKGNINMVKAQLPLIQQTSDPMFWVNATVPVCDSVRQQLRGLIKFITDFKTIVFSALNDRETDRKEGEQLPAADEYADYKARVNRYITEHRDTLVIHKLIHNVPITAQDYAQLEHILTSELGSAEEYQKEYRDTPFGILVRRIAGMDHDAVEKAFADFIHAQQLNVAQMNFLKTVISYVEKNGCIQDAGDLVKAPFNNPSFFDIFTEPQQDRFIQAIDALRQNAGQHTA